jgi:diadenylate cyclase
MDFIEIISRYLRWQDIIDVLLVSTIIYNLFLWSKGNRSKQLIQGILVLLVFYFISVNLQLFTITWLLQKVAPVFILALVVVFQPELREALERIGRTSMFDDSSSKNVSADTVFFQIFIKAISSLSEHKTGSLIVLTKTTGLKKVVESGTKLDALPSQEIVLSIFHGKNPLHDGAVVVTDGRISSAGCLLPLSESRLVEKRLGTRHRAALGLSEQSDAIIIITSEETGIISIAHEGDLTRYYTKESLEEFLFTHYRNDSIDQEPRSYLSFSSIRDFLKRAS